MSDCATMIYASAGVFAVLYILLLVIVGVLYYKYWRECKDIAEGKGKGNDEWRLVHKLMGQTSQLTASRRSLKSGSGYSLRDLDSTAQRNGRLSKPKVPRNIATSEVNNPLEDSKLVEKEFPDTNDQF
jgi:hypothetical protein